MPQPPSLSSPVDLVALLDLHADTQEVNGRSGGVGFWLRNLAISAAVGLIVGFAVGGTVGRVFMRILFLARQDSLGVETAMGAIIGEFTSGGTTAIYAFGGIAGVALGVAYAVGRTLLPSGTRTRTVVFTFATTAFMLGQIIRGNLEDFALLPVTLSLVLIVGSIALAAAPVPFFVERLAPDRTRRPGRVAQGVVLLSLAGFGVFAVTGVVMAYGA